MTKIRLLARTLLPLTHRCLAVVLLWTLAGFVTVQAGDHTSAGKSNAKIQPAVLYHNYCSVCHGDKGDGRSRAQYSLNPPPRDFTAPAAAELTRERMINSVTHGRPGTAMTPWRSQLSTREIEALVDYVRNTFMPASASAGSSRGRVVFSRNCSVCHGEKGDGRSRAQASLNPPPRNFTAPGLIKELSRERMITSVTYGRADTAMAGFKTQLSKEDIEAVVDYIRTGFMASTEGISGIQNNARSQAPMDHTEHGAKPATGHVHKATAVNMSAPMPNALKGDLAKGRAFYLDNCATCHGKTGDGRGPRAYFINPKPRNFLHPASRQELNRVELFEMISEGRPGTEMPAWNKVLSPQEIANVAEFVFQTFIRPDTATVKPAQSVKQ